MWYNTPFVKLISTTNSYIQIPVYRGCNKPILGHVTHAAHYHGIDGFGDVPDPEAPDLTHAQSEHAVTALIRLVNEFPGDVFQSITLLLE